MADTKDKVINDIVYIWNEFFYSEPLASFIKKVLGEIDCTLTEVEARVKLNEFITKEGLLR